MTSGLHVLQSCRRLPQSAAGAALLLLLPLLPTHGSAIQATGTGLVLAKSSAAMTWARRATSTTVDLYSVSCPTARVCVAVGYRPGSQPQRDGFATILVSADGGATWRNRTSGAGRALSSSSQLQSVDCPSVTSCVAVGYTHGRTSWNGTTLVLTSSNGGRTWSRHGPKGTYSLDGVSCPKPRVCVAVSNQSPSPGILRTTDGWTRFTARSIHLDDAPLFSVDCRLPTCVAVGHYGTIVTSADSGTTWRIQRRSPTASGLATESYTTVTCTSVRECVTVGAVWDSRSRRFVRGLLLTTVDGGRSWSRQPVAMTNQANGVSCPSRTTCVLVGDHGAIFVGAEGGTTWRKPGSGTNRDLYRVSCPNPHQCVAVGKGGTILLGRTHSTGAIPKPKVKVTGPATKVVVFHPSGVRRDIGQGDCFHSSTVVARPNAWRCDSPEGIEDPCFSASSAAMTVLCDAGPFNPLKDPRGDLLHLTKALPAPRSPRAGGSPWIFELAGGLMCQTYSGVPLQINNSSGGIAGFVFTRCSDGHFLWKVNRGAVWTAQEISVSRVPAGGFPITRAISVKISRIWV